MVKAACAVIGFLTVNFLTPAHAAPMACGQAEDVLAKMQADYGEQPAFEGQTTETDKPIVVLANPDTGTFTVIIVLPDQGAACLIAAGDGWHALPPGERPTRGRSL